MQERPVSIPLALKQSAAQALGSPDAQVVLGNIKDEFINNIGGPNQDPTDPNYIKRWRHAQTSADEELRKMLGTEAYNRLSALALLEANSKANPGSGD
jgi:hypothetical protein